MLYTYRADENAVDLIERMLLYDDKKRITAAEALEHPYFQVDPQPCLPSQLPRFQEDLHEYTVRREKQKAMKLSEEPLNGGPRSGSQGSNGSSSQKGSQHLEASGLKDKNSYKDSLMGVNSTHSNSKSFPKKFNQGEGKKIVRKRNHMDDKSFKIPLKKSKMIALDSGGDPDPVPFQKQTLDPSDVEMSGSEARGKGTQPIPPLMPKCLVKRESKEERKESEKEQAERLASNEYFSN